MSIKLTRKIGDKEVELDLISLNGKSVVRDASFKKSGVSKEDLEKEGFGVESEVLKEMQEKKKDSKVEKNTHK